MRKLFLIGIIIFSQESFCQLKWTNVDSLYQPLPKSVHVYFTKEPIDTSPFRAFYLIADLKDKKLNFTVDTTLGRRITPTKFYEKDDQPLVVVNCTFFSFETNKNLNVVIKDGKLVSYNSRTVDDKGVDWVHQYYPNLSAIGINKKRKADIAWLRRDSSGAIAYASQYPANFMETNLWQSPRNFHKWKMQTAVGGGPVLLQNGETKITNEEEMKFRGKAINDKHPRTAMGYTKDGKLIILMIEGRNKNASGATLTQEAQIFKDLGCWEALNLDGGGSSCMLVNGRQTIKPSDVTGQRPVPAVFIIKRVGSSK